MKYIFKDQKTPGKGKTVTVPDDVREYSLFIRANSADDGVAHIKFFKLLGDEPVPYYLTEQNLYGGQCCMDGDKGFDIPTNCVLYEFTISTDVNRAFTAVIEKMPKDTKVDAWIGPPTGNEYPKAPVEEKKVDLSPIWIIAAVFIFLQLLRAFI